LSLPQSVQNNATPGTVSEPPIAKPTVRFSEVDALPDNLDDIKVEEVPLKNFFDFTKGTSNYKKLKKG
jgi:hypothetical protein